MNEVQVQRHKGEKDFFMDLGGAVVSKEPLEGTQRLQYSDLSLTELWQSPID